MLPAILPGMTDLVIEVRSGADLLAALGPVPSDGTAVTLVGGADFTEPERLEELRAFFRVLADYLERSDTAVVDGGTDSGVMRLIAEAKATVGGTFRLVGVAPQGAFDRTTRSGDPITVARDHSMIIVVPGTDFGDESDWLFGTADHLARGSAPTVVVNGGKLALEEAHRRIADGHLVIAVAGSGRAADELAADGTLRASGTLRVIPVTVDESGLAAAIETPIEIPIETPIETPIESPIGETGSEGGSDDKPAG